MALIGFIGLGNMGMPMALNLLKAGYRVKGFDLVSETMTRLSKAGGLAASSARDSATSADVIISMLPSGSHVESLYCGEESLFELLEPDTLVIDASTIDVATTKRIASRAKEKGLVFLDAPVSGGVSGAESGTLTFIIGGKTQEKERARPFLEAMGKHLYLAGPAGSGQMAKACNNMLLAILMTGTSEILALGKACGLDLSILSEIMSKSSGANWVLDKYNPVPGIMENTPASKAYHGGFMTRLMLKDLGLAIENATGNQASIPMGTLARNLFSLHAANGFGEMDFSSVYKLFCGESTPENKDD